MKKFNKIDSLYPDIMVNDIKINSKDVRKGDIFVCVTGVNSNRNDFIDEAINNGASCIITNKKIDCKIPVIRVDNPDQYLVELAKKFYDYKPDDLFLIGTTGTNGKTTVASIISDMIGNDLCGYMGTNGIICNKFNKSIRNTTPGADRIFKYFKMFKNSGCTYVSMEVSSEAFYRNRLNGIKFDIGILTNISEDHLNVHKSLKNYIDCKKELFRNIKANGFSILNVDEKYFKDFYKIAKGNILTYGKKESDLRIIDYKLFIDHTDITLKYKNKSFSFTSPLLGEFNVYNVCGAFLTLLSLGFDIDEIILRVKLIKTPKGRVQLLDYGQKYKIVLDYAHTTDALVKIYSFLKQVTNNQIITVIGSAGGREKEKRKYMGKVVLDNSNYTIFTMDDPRYEDVNSIIDDLVSISDKTNYERIIDRKEAIYKAFSIAKDNDIVLIAGKGCDDYMAIGSDYIPYNDYDVINSFFK